MHVSHAVWKTICVAAGIPQRHNTNTDKRIRQLLMACYEGLQKKLAVEDDFVFFRFDMHYWDRFSPRKKKKTRAKLGARLIRYEGEPGLYIFDPSVDDGSSLEEA